MPEDSAAGCGRARVGKRRHNSRHFAAAAAAALAARRLNVNGKLTSLIAERLLMSAPLAAVQTSLNKHSLRVLETLQ